MIFRYRITMKNFHALPVSVKIHAVLAGKLILMTKVMNIIKQ